MAPSKVLLLGATGFIGGSILHELLGSSESQITVAVRRQDQAKLLASKGVQTILIDGLDDVDGLEQAAANHDIVINAATGQHFGAPEALIRGLGKRREQQQHGQAVHFIHLSGTTNIAVQSITPSPYQLQHFSDTDDIYEYEKSRDNQEPYGQRTADIVVVEAGEKFNVKTYIIMPATVYGRGTGFFRKQSHQVPVLIRNALKYGYAEHIGTGEGLSGNVHVADLARLFTLLAVKTSAGEHVPSGRQGYYFANKSSVPRSISLEEGAQKLADGDTKFAERCFASRSSSWPERAFALGWKPLHTDQDFEPSIKATVEEIYKGEI